MNDKPFIPLVNKELFMTVFGNPDNIEILEAFLEDLFDVPRGCLRGKVTIENADIPAKDKDYISITIKDRDILKNIQLNI